MPFTVQIDSDRRLVKSRWNGIATSELLVAYIEQVWSDTNLRDFNELIDFRDIAEIQIPSDDIRKYAEYSRKYDNPEVSARSAVVATTDLVYGLSRMFSTMRALDPDDKREFRVFDDMGNALDWLESIP